MKSLLLSLIFLGVIINAAAQGYWTPVANTAPHYNYGIMLLLPDGRVMAKTSAGGTDGYGNTWDLLTPDAHGSYINGIWSSLPPMHDTRLYFSSRHLKDGRIYVAGGEYGTGADKGEIYDIATNTWTMTGAIPTLSYGPYYIGDGNSELLPDGKVLQGLYSYFGRPVLLYDPVTNSYSFADSCLNSQNESTWLKLSDNSILFADPAAVSSERYIPATSKWVVDATVPDSLYDSFFYETGAATLLPDGKALFLGATGRTLFYTPSGSTLPGTWTAGPIIPDTLCAADAPLAMMPNGKILCTFSPKSTMFIEFQKPSTFYEFNYTTKTYTKINAPNGTDTLKGMTYEINMLVLPDGNIMLSREGHNHYYIYTPGGTPLAAGKPTINNIIKQNCDTFTITGTLFNGISQGAAYGDDGQMATNFPVVRLSSDSNVFYVRTYNWNRTGVQTGSLPDTASFILPAGLSKGIYKLAVVANGIASDSVNFATCDTNLVVTNLLHQDNIHIFPNPVTKTITIAAAVTINDIAITNLLGQTLIHQSFNSSKAELNIESLQQGIYVIKINNKVIQKFIKN